jgi:hypothetical protein
VLSIHEWHPIQILRKGCDLETAISILISTVLSGLVLWLSIKIVERHNPANTLLTAMLLGLGFSIFGSFCFGPLLILPLVALLLLLVRFYDLGIGKSLLVVVLIGALKLALGLVMASALMAVGVVS